MRATARARRMVGVLVAARVPDHHLPRGALPVWFIVSTALRIERRLPARPDRLPDPPDARTRCARCCFDQPLPRWMWNSFLVTVSSVAVSTFVALLAAYAVVFGRFRGHSDLPLDERRADGRAAGDAARADVRASWSTPAGQPPAVGDRLLQRACWCRSRSSSWRTSSAPFPQELIEAAASEGAGPFTVFRRDRDAALGSGDVHAHHRAGDLGVERAADRARVPAERELAHADGRADAVPGPLRRRTSRSSSPARSISILPVVVLYLSGQRFFVRGLTAGIGK